jgi:hypothetical protein
MEHTWDEAYGYIYGVDGTNFWVATLTVCRCWFQHFKSNIDLAFRTGRAAIVANDYVTRDANRLLKLALIPAVRAYFIFKKENRN